MRQQPRTGTPRPEARAATRYERGALARDKGKLVEEEGGTEERKGRQHQRRGKAWISIARVVERERSGKTLGGLFSGFGRSISRRRTDCCLRQTMTTAERSVSFLPAAS